MKKYKPLDVRCLQTQFDPKKIPVESSNAISKRTNKYKIQQRAFEALQLALHIQSTGYNVYLSGENDLGRLYFLTEYLDPKAKKMQTPPDLVYVHNFEDHDAPLLLSLPAGMGNKLKKILSKTYSNIRRELSLQLDKTNFSLKRSSLYDGYQNQKDQLFKEMDKLAVSKSYTLDIDSSGVMALYPLLDGKRLSDEDFEKLNSSARKDLKAKGDSLMQPMTSFLHKMLKAEKKFLEKKYVLEKELVEEVLRNIFDPMAEKCLSQADNNPDLQDFFRSLRNEVLEHIELIIPNENKESQLQIHSSSAASHHEQLQQDLSSQFDINVFVDNTFISGAPIVIENHPTVANLMGCIEREAELGTLVTNFTLIKAGSIHKANGGFLVLYIEDLLSTQHSWDALLRALRAGISCIEDSGEEEGTKAKGIRPEPVPLNIKVILIGEEETYENLLHLDNRFSRLFKVKAHLSETAEKNSENIKIFLAHIKQIIENEELLPFSRDALAKLVDYGSELVQSQQKLSLKFPLIRELMVEASSFASLSQYEFVGAESIETALRNKNFRNNLLEEEFLEDYDKKIIKVITQGSAVGMVNGLAVSSYGSFEFGLPHKICCTIGAGSGGIIDLEREAELGGPIHTKAVMILKSYLVNSFAHNKALIFTGSIGFEQNYAGIEGDSASGAELAALLSALAQVEISLSLAFTGAVSQFGEIMAVGGVSRKIEGFYKVCKRHGLNGKQGVIIPHDNISHVLLSNEVAEAIQEKKFHIYAVQHISEAMELLTGIPSGKLQKSGGYTSGSLYDKVDKRLKELNKVALKQYAKK